MLAVSHCSTGSSGFPVLRSVWAHCNPVDAGHLMSRSLHCAVAAVSVTRPGKLEVCPSLLPLYLLPDAASDSILNLKIQAPVYSCTDTRISSLNEPMGIFDSGQVLDPVLHMIWVTSHPSSIPSASRVPTVGM
ncbi:hypothetical protein LIA77_02786 [Sarocladium implicatum]|nr:hypothetical protein LIA77_02786 [Sarocladium implicatum]